MTPKPMDGLPDPPPLYVTPFFEMFNTATHEPEWLIEGLIPRGTTFCLNGRGGVFKSWTFTAMGVSVASCSKFLGKFPCPRYSSVGNSVLFIQLEETKVNEAAPKAQWIAKGMELKPETIQDLLFSYVVDQPFRIDDKRRVDQLKFIIDEAQPDLVLWDNARKMLAGNKNDGAWADSIAWMFKDLQTVFPSAHGLLDHWRKKSADKAMNDPDEMASGNLALRDAMAIWLPVEAPLDSDVVTMYHNKMRRGKKLGAFNYRVRIVDSLGMASLEYIGAATGTVEEGSCGEAIVAVLRTEERVWTQPEIITRIPQFSERQIKYAAKVLWRDRVIDLDPSKGGQPTLLRLRNPLSAEQSNLSENWSKTNRTDRTQTGHKKVSGWDGSNDKEDNDL